MIDNVRTGQNIVICRQKLGWTQGELARRLNVTHQAVSKWENGVSFPDITTLLDLSRLFGVSMETLLTGDSLFSADSTGNALEFNSAVNGEALGSTDTEIEEAPDNRPDERVQALDAVSEETLNPPPASLQDRAFDWEEVVALAPFASRETLDQLVQQCVQTEAPDHLPALAPFLSRQTLDQLIEANFENQNWHDHIPALAPFLSHQTLDRLVHAGICHADWDDIAALAPFCGHDTLDYLTQLCEEDACPIDHLTGLAPFLNRQTLDRLLRKHAENADWGLISSLAPFVSRDTLDWLVSRCDAAHAREHLPALAPFLSRQTLDRLLLGANPSDRTPEADDEGHQERRWEAIATEVERNEERRWEAIAAEVERNEARYDRLAARAERIERRQAERASHFSERMARRAAERTAQPIGKDAPLKESASASSPAETLMSFSPLLSQYLSQEQLSQLFEGARSMDSSSDARRTEIRKAESTASTLSEYAEQTLGMLYASCDTADPIVGRFEEIRRAIEGQDYAVLNEFAALLDRHIGPQWLEEYAALCASQNANTSENFEEQLHLALTQRNWNWIEDHAHLITDAEIIRRIALISSSEGYFDFIPLFLEHLDQHSIDYAARQAVRLGRAEDVLSFSERVSPGILD